MLIAISLTGTTLVVRDSSGQTWLHGQLAGGRAELTDPARAEAVINEHSLERVDRQFADWQALEAFRAEHIKRAGEGLTLPIAALGVKDIEGLVDTAEQLAERGEHDRASTLLLRLRTAPALKRGTPLYQRLVALVASDTGLSDS
jgi:hypothetical protein